MALIGDLVEDDPADRIADLVVHVANLRRENDALRLQRDRYRSQAERARVAARQQPQFGSHQRRQSHFTVSAAAATALSGSGSTWKEATA